MAQNIFAVENEVQRILMVQEITGQLSDGAWENARPYEHWKNWCDAEVVVDAEAQGRNFSALKDNYGLHSLIEYIGDRMLFIAKFAHLHPEISAQLNEIPDGPQHLARFKKYSEDGSKYFTDMLKKWEDLGITQEMLDEVDGYDRYTMKHLHKELSAIKKAMKIWRTASKPEFVKDAIEALYPTAEVIEDVVEVEEPETEAPKHKLEDFVKEITEEEDTNSNVIKSVEVRIVQETYGLTNVKMPRGYLICSSLLKEYEIDTVIYVDVKITPKGTVRILKIH